MLMELNTLDAAVIFLCLSSAVVLYLRQPSRKGATSRPQGYILQNQVTHARLLPAESAHAFTYPTLSLLVSLNALESHSLDLLYGRIFGYGGWWGRLTGLRSEPYLNNSDGKSIKEKLQRLLRHRGYLGNAEFVDDAWMMTMPSFVGFEGINPLTVYFCYKEQAFWITALEIHNTFGESHVHVLQINQSEDEQIPKGFNHQWTFRRQFHVSPFNDRSGFYTVSVKAPSHPPMPIIDGELSADAPPRPAVRVHLFTPSELDPSSPGALKLTALLRPTTAIPLTSVSVLLALVRAPFALLLTTPRILHQAWILHYRKCLDVYLRPEPLPARSDWRTFSSILDQDNVNISGGVKWLNEALLEKFARSRIEAFLSVQVEETGMKVTLTPANPDIPARTFSPSIWADGSDSKYHLRISYLSPRFFTYLFLCPSAEHALLLGCDTEKQFHVSSRQLFLNTFSSIVASNCPSFFVSSLQVLRLRTVPKDISIPAPALHFLDERSTVIQRFLCNLAIRLYFILDRVETFVFQATHARVVEGQEPWLMWQRASRVYTGGSSQLHAPVDSGRKNIFG